MNNGEITEKKKLRASKKARGNRKYYDKSFSAFLSFGRPMTICLSGFFFVYGLILCSIFHMLDEQKHSGTVQLKPFEGVRQDTLRKAASAGQEKFSKAASAVKSKIRELRQGRGMTDEILLKAAQDDFKVLKSRKQQAETRKQRNFGKNQTSPPGFVVLGMHRSGTSMLSGLLVMGMGYNVGGPLIGPSFDNEKGFFELVDVVLQNDEFFSAQRMGWSFNAISYDAERALQDKKEGTISFTKGKKALEFLNNPDNAPWLQKDPRMCITLPTWLALLNSPPAVVFTFRHPVEVAKSLNKREENFEMDHGLRLWIVYNMRAIQNSNGLCRVLSSNEDVLSDPLSEVKRISKELTNRCGVAKPPNKLTKKLVDKFVDPKLQHSKARREEAKKGAEIVADFNGCVVRKLESKHADGTVERARETDLYFKAMKVYCDMKSGEAYKEGYAWPQLN